MIRPLVLVTLAGCALDQETASDPHVIDQAERDTGEIESGTVTTARGDLTVSYERFGDRAVFQGDIEISLDRKTDEASVATRSDTAYRWSYGIVPYEISPSAYTDVGIQEIEAAIAEFNATTIFKWIPRNQLPSSYTDYVYITNINGCSSFVGRQGTGRQNLSLGGGCFQRGTILHELGHAVGLWHEQSRSDRDDHVILHEDNIISQYWIDQYDTYVEAGEDGQDLYDFDFYSVMLYPSFVASISKDKSKPIMTDLNGNTWGWPTTLSVNDISGMTRFQIFPTSGKTFKLSFAHSGKCLDVEGASRVAHRNVNQWSCHGLANQRWYNKQLEWNPNGVIVAGENSGQCLDIVNSSTASGAGLQQRPCNGAANQRFDFVPNGDGHALKAKHSNMCLTVDSSSTANGTWVRQRPCVAGAANQRLKIVY